MPNSGDVIDTLTVAVKRVLDGPGGIDRTGLTDLQCAQACLRLYARGLYLAEKQAQNAAAQQATIDAANAAAVTASQTIV